MPKVTIEYEGDELAVKIGGGVASFHSSGECKSKSISELEFRSVEAGSSFMNLEDAEEEVDELGHGWRLPTVDEMLSIITRNCYGPAVDTNRFPFIRSSWYWTSTPSSWNPKLAWMVNFRYGEINANFRTNHARVLAVRERLSD